MNTQASTTPVAQRIAALTADSTGTIHSPYGRYSIQASMSTEAFKVYGYKGYKVFNGMHSYRRAMAYFTRSCEAQEQAQHDNSAAGAL